MSVFMGIHYLGLLNKQITHIYYFVLKFLYKLAKQHFVGQYQMYVSGLIVTENLKRVAQQHGEKVSVSASYALSTLTAEMLVLMIVFIFALCALVPDGYESEITL